MVPPHASPVSHGSLSEDGILACLGRHFPQTGPSLLLGRGDDCAVLRGGKPLAVSSDLFLEDVHFRRSYFTPEETGYKALAVNVSDLAACGARPAAFTLCLGLPGWVDEPWLDAFFSGMAGLASHSMAAPGLFPSVQFFDPANPMTIVWVFGVMGLAVVLSFVLTLLLGFEDIPVEDEAEKARALQTAPVQNKTAEA